MVLWGAAQPKQLKALRALYDATVRHCALGDWALGFEALVVTEDGLSALLEMCRCTGKCAPALPLRVLMAAVSGASGSGELHLTRLGHVLVKLAHKCDPLACTSVALLHSCPPLSTACCAHYVSTMRR
jgi:hypothetical protein